MEKKTNGISALQITLYVILGAATIMSSSIAFTEKFAFDDYKLRIAEHSRDIQIIQVQYASDIGVIKSELKLLREIMIELTSDIDALKKELR